MKATVDKDACTGCELCTQTCPEVFQMADGIAEAYTNPVPKEYEESARQAADECPVEAIQIA